MPRAYVLFNVSSGSEQHLLKELRGIAGVQDAVILYGVHDLIAKVKTDSMEQLKELVSRRLRLLADVRSTLTLILVAE